MAPEKKMTCLSKGCFTTLKAKLEQQIEEGAALGQRIQENLAKVKL